MGNSHGTPRRGSLPRRAPPQRVFTEQLPRRGGSGVLRCGSEAESFGSYDLIPPLQRVLTKQGIEEHEFKLVGSSSTEYPSSAVTLSCNLSPELSAVDLEIRWFKETECIYLYKNRQVTEGKGYEDRVSLFRDELEKGNVSLQLKNCSWSDLGDYLCQVTDGDTTEELTVKMTRSSQLPPRFLRKVFRPPPQRVFTEQIDRKWTNEERLKMEKSSLLIEHNSLLSEYKKKCSNLEKTEEELNNTKMELEQVMETNQNKLERLEKELQDKNSQMQEMMILVEQRKTELSEKNKELEENERLLFERERQQMEKDKLKEEQLLERTDPDPSVPIRRKNSMEFLPPKMSGESSGADPPESVPVTELRLVLLGRSGSGKTAAGNTILGREERSQAGTSTPNQQSESTQEEVAGRKVTVMDTPDWFCSELPLDKLRQDVGCCIHLSAPGPHAFLLVLPVKQATGEEGGMLEKMEEIFGDRCWRNTMILFTVSDELQKENIEAFIQSGNQEVQRLVEKCGNRFHCINIKQRGDGSQVSELLEKIEKMERFYSSEIYLETESQIRAMEATILKERGEKRRKEERQMKEKLEKQVEKSLRKIEGVIQEHEGDIRQLNDRTTELERKMKEERDEEKKNELEKELDREVERRTEMEKEVNRLKEKRVKERREMEEKHEQNMEELREMYEGEARIEAERNLMKIIMPELQRNILASKTKMQEEFSRQMEEKDLEMEKLQQRLSELTQTHSVLEEVYERTVKSTAEAEGAAPVEQSKGITQTFMGLFR